MNGQTNDSFTGHISYDTERIKCYTSFPSYVWGIETTNYVYYDAFGQQHGIDYTYNPCMETVEGTRSTYDGSGYWFDGYQIVDRYGKTSRVPQNENSNSGSITDTNGNIINNNGGTFTDTLGVNALVLSGTGTASDPRIFTYPVAQQANSATTAAATMSFHTYTIQTNFGCSSIGEYGPTSVDLVDRVTLADGGFYQFNYEQTPGVSGAYTGRLASVTLPTGGTISYQYSGGCNGNGMSADGTPGNLNRVTSAGTRQYTRSASTTTLQDEANNQSVYTFTDLYGMFYETHRKVYQSTATGTPLLEQQTCINNTIPCDGTSFALPASTINSLTAKNGIAQENTVTTFDPATNLPSVVNTYDGSGTTLLQTAYANHTTDARVSESGVKDGQGNLVSKITYGYDEQGVTTTSGIPQHTSGINVGNQTSTHTWINTSNTTLDTSTDYYDTGVPVSSTGPTGATTYTYDSTQGFATQVTPPTPSSGISLPSYASYDVNSGIQLSASDANFPTSPQVQFTQYDSRLRPTLIQTADGGSSNYVYRSANQTGIYTALNSAQSAETEVQYDGYGRLSRVAVASGQSSSPWYQTDYCYDAVGNLQFQSARYLGSGWGLPKQCSGNGTAYNYDGLGRVTSTVTPDGTTSYQYYSRATLTTDPNNVQKITQVDGLGRMSAVCEISGTSLQADNPASCGLDISGTGYLTQYTYVDVNHEIDVLQGVQTRVFKTDSFGRTIYNKEPESGETKYSYIYNSIGLQVARTKPSANQSQAAVQTHTITQYDSMGRIVSISYDDGISPNRSYSYDQPTVWGNVPLGPSKGHLTFATGAIGGTVFGYDPLGRNNYTQQCLPGLCGNWMHDVVHWYTYDYSGNLTQFAYMTQGAVGTQVQTNYGYNVASEITSVSDTASGSLISNVQMGSFGPHTWTLGNGLNGYQDYDGVGRPSTYRLCSGVASSTCNPSAYGSEVGRTSGRVTYLSDSGLAAGVTYGYDDFNRLTSSSMSKWNGTQQTFTYDYDRYGNRWHQNAPQGGPAPQFAIDKATNRVSGFTYDAAGNLTNDRIHNYLYDADGNVMQVDSGAGASYYAYDALNHRVVATVNGSTTLYAFDTGGHRVASFDNAGNPLSNQIYSGGAPIAYYQGGAIHYQHQDWLGTERVRTNGTGVVEGIYSSLPFGDAYSASGSDSDAYHFAQLDHDSETDTSHAQFRQYSSTQGRWMSPDPYSGSYDPANPQSFNRYAYALNNPLAFNDPSGLDCQLPDGTIFFDYELPDYEQGVCSYLGGTYTPPATYTVTAPDSGGGNSTAPQPDPLSTPSPVLGSTPSQSSGSSGGAGSSSAPNTWSRINRVLQCGSKTANQFSIAGVLGINEETHPVGAALSNAFLGNTFSGISDTITHVATGHFGAAYADFALGGTAQGLPIGTVPAAKGIAGLSTEAALGAAVGEEMVTPVGWAKLAIDGAAYLGSLAYCSAHP